MLNKKGDVTDILTLVVTIFIFGLGLFILAFVIPTIGNGMAQTALNESSEGAFAIEELNNFGLISIQRGFLMIAVILIIGMLISSFIARTHPIFIFLYLFFFIIAIILAVYLSNSFEYVSQIDAFSSILASQGIFTLVMSNLVKITLGAGVLGMIVFFSKGISGGPSRP